MHQRRRGGFAIGPGNSYDTMRRQVRPRHREQFDIANQRDAARLCLIRDRVAVDRNAGRNDNGVIACQVAQQRIGNRGDVCNLGPRAFVIVPCQNFGSARDKRTCRRKAGTRKSQYCELPVFKGRGSDHLSLRVDSPASANTKATIQKRMTTVGSDQPSCSKWW